MKTNYTVFKMIALALMFTCNSWGQTTLAKWNFNGADAASVPGGGSNPLPSEGSGTIGLVGTATTSATPFAAGVNSTGVGSSDPVTTNPPNLAWAITNFPALGAGNKTSGIQINFVSANYAGIKVKFDQRLSNKAANTYVVQYTADRLAASPVWVDAQTFSFTPAATGTGDVWYNSRTVDLTGVTGLNNSDMPAIRIVAAFDPIAGNYLASTSTSTYDGTGVVRFDMVTVTAETNLATTVFEANNNSFTVAPNPSNKEIVLFNKTVDIEVYDILGKMIVKSNNTSSLDTTNFNSGVYMIKTANGQTQKLIVK
ncbi:T9SS type A sorting domain-containing protein [Flavobacterium sp. CYK-55]|uniref:T9SS type A sorting domain-containing protein n=1 Tax=Flavobacterium sp. CYK-55 TaxID=2835529 RepID=UPI001BCB2A94|nr:T9SS type A sorting domain-containing protein [Flavobacterium sp. CYK-55]MBS7787062.1 T9SS type A sorting domain-containing protein [Flavobacterium sp. CYK-55]